MNIIYFGKYTLNDFHASAGALRVLNQIKYLHKSAHVEVITISKHKAEYSFNINLKRFDNKLIHLCFLPFYWLIICVLLILKRKRGKNIILLESTVDINFSIPIFWSKLLGYRIVHDVVENFFLAQEVKSIAQKGGTFIMRLFYTFLKFYTDGIIVISDRLFNQYIKFNRPIIKIYNSNEFKESTNIFIPKQKTFTFLYSGTFGMKDGVKDLILAFNILTLKYNNVRLVLTGTNSSNYFNECLELIKRQKKIIYKGFISRTALHSEYQKADVLMVIRDNSLYANFGFPFKLSEYLTYKKPVIASSVSDISKLFIDYKDILLVEPSNIASIVEKMEYSLNHKNELDKLAMNGFMKGKSYFSIPTNGQALFNFLLSI